MFNDAEDELVLRTVARKPPLAAEVLDLVVGQRAVRRYWALEA